MSSRRRSLSVGSCPQSKRKLFSSTARSNGATLSQNPSIETKDDKDCYSSLLRAMTRHSPP
ncbi:Hypothetical protein FKW44_018493 [Caligus rogercresseyi]|uniref:Uncharacterized protein n=1 Tax=Caligus rogercresseyi TaxID=217165 RepID=A0A7T8GUH2_CALRO|nr:Hypothetical protein FKW44_018493 [Caligus rogercresseyi]